MVLGSHFKAPLFVAIAVSFLAGCNEAPPSKPDTSLRKVEENPRETPAREVAPAGPAKLTVRDDARALYLRGCDYYKAHDYLTAQDEFQRALLLDPNYTAAWNKIALCYYARHMYSDEILAYKQCLAIDPEFEEALLNLGHAELARDHLEEAAGLYSRLLKKNPTHPVALFNLGLVHHDLGQLDRAVDDLEHFLKLYPHDEDLAPKAKRHLERSRADLERLNRGR